MCLHICIHTCVYVCGCMCVCVCMYACSYVCMCVHMCKTSLRVVAYVYNVCRQEDCESEVSHRLLKNNNNNNKVFLKTNTDKNVTSFFKKEKLLSCQQPEPGPCALNSHSHVCDFSAHPWGQVPIYALLGAFGSRPSTRRAEWRPLDACRLSFMPSHILSPWFGIFPPFLKSH